MINIDNWIVNNNQNFYPSFTISFQFQIPTSTIGTQTLVHRQSSSSSTNIFMLSFDFSSLYLQNVSIVIQDHTCTIPLSVQLVSGISNKINFC